MWSRYLVAALDVPVRERCTVYEIGGADRVSYAGMMQAYARSQGLRRPMIRVPWLTPRLSSGWLALVTPLYYRVGRHLLEGVRNETVVTSDAAARDFPQIRPMGIEAAIARSLANEDREYRGDPLERRPLHQPAPQDWPAERVGRRYVDQRTLDVPCPASEVFETILCIGRTEGLVRLDLALESARSARPAQRRRGLPPRPPRPHLRDPRGHLGLLARRGAGAGPAAAPGRRDARARQGMAPVRADPPGRRTARASCRPPCGTRWVSPATCTGSSCGPA